jgi:hypothetical protein
VRERERERERTRENNSKTDTSEIVRRLKAVNGCISPVFTNF